MTNFDMIQRVLNCHDLHAQKVYRAMVLGGYDFDNARMDDFVTAVNQVSKTIIRNENEEPTK